MRLGISKLLGKLVVKYVITYFKYALKTKSANYISNGVYAMFFFHFHFSMIFFMKAYVVGTHLNCIDKSMPFKWLPTTYAFIKK